MSTRRTHPVNVTHLVLGLVFLGIAGSWALREADIVDTGDARWGLPLILLVAGLAGLAASVAKGLSRNRPGLDAAGDPPVYQPLDAWDDDETRPLS